MNSIFNIVNRLLRRASINRQSYVMLKRLRKENPSCTIQSAALRNVSMGEYVAIIDRAYLDQVSFGNFSYVSNNSSLCNVTIGNFCSIGPYVQIGLGTHPSKVFVSTYPAFYSEKKTGCPVSFRKDKIFDDAAPRTTIANDVWIGTNVIIPGGIHIDTGAVVAAGAVVVKDVPPYAIVGGNPAKIIRYRFSQEQIGILLKSEWWNWPIEKIRQQVDDFADIEKFQVKNRVVYD